MTNHGGLSRRGEQSLTLYLLEVVAPFIYGHPLEISKTPLSLIRALESHTVLLVSLLSG